MRFPIGQALVTAHQALARLALHDAVLRCSYAGSVRRMEETVGDIDLVIASERPEEVVDAFFSLTQGTRQMKRSEEWRTKAITVTHDGLRLELSVVPPQFYGPTLVIYSGGRVHTCAMCKRALQCMYGVYFGLLRYWWHSVPLMEVGGKIEILMRLLRTSNAEESEQETGEEAIYKRLGVQWIPPALRQGREELETALAKSIIHTTHLENRSPFSPLFARW